ncbi:MAG TPA: anti-sigma factor [Anaerolineales bacterium]|nr:anti-sigma factor [Anaerolineales bacterium]
MSVDAHVLDLLPAYALGSLDADEASQVEQHLLSCVICRNESNAFQAVAEQLSFAAPIMAPPPDLKDRLMQRIQAERPKQKVSAPRSKRPWLERLLPVWGLASLCLVIALAGLNLFLWQRIVHSEFFMSPDGMRAVPLSSPDAASRATGFVLISEDGDSGALVVDGLPPLDNSQQYQVWLIRDGQRTSGAVFSTDEKNYGGTRIRAPGSLLAYSAVSITIEPTGGSPQPTGAQVLGGPLFNP